MILFNIKILRSKNYSINHKLFNKDLERKEDKSQWSQQERNLKFKLSVENIDYGLKRIKEIDFFEIFKHSLVKNLDKFSFK